ncbi:MAG: hypothetical protein F4213_13735 [Boseongicola sp. SB0677_bin_26]|nr:hypothetical protein [Boseongicola sp. SB0665_bin_10]MYG27063.1 hypothetical protein [Boseongicola sp. SB0677_bin_26]
MAAQPAEKAVDKLAARRRASFPPALDHSLADEKVGELPDFRTVTVRPVDPADPSKVRAPCGSSNQRIISVAPFRTRGSAYGDRPSRMIDGLTPLGKPLATAK